MGGNSNTPELGKKRKTKEKENLIQKKVGEIIERQNEKARDRLKAEKNGGHNEQQNIHRMVGHIPDLSEISI